MKYSIGKARFKEERVGVKSVLVSDTRINLRKEIKNAFNRGAEAALNSQLKIDNKRESILDEQLSREDSLQLIKEGLIEVQEKESAVVDSKEQKKQEKQAEKERKRQEKEAAKRKNSDVAVLSKED